MEQDPIQIRQGGGFLSLFGLPFFLAGLGVLGGGLFGAVPGGSERVFMILFSIPFTLVGTVLVLGRSGLEISRMRRKVKTWYGLLFPMRSTEHDVTKFADVLIIPEVRGGKNKSTFYVVKFRHATNQKENLELQACRSPEEGRTFAERIAKHLGMGITDHSTGSAIIREAGKLDESIKERILRTGEKVVMPPLPSGSQINVHLSEDHRSAFFSIPAPGFRPEMLITLVGAVIVSGVVLLQGGMIFSSSLGEFTGLNKVGLMLGGFLVACLPVLIGLGYTWRMATTGEHFAVSDKGILIEERGLLRNSRTSLANKEIEELYAQDNAKPGFSTRFLFGPCVLIRSDRCSVVLGAGLTKPEAVWLVSAIKYFLVSDQSSLP